MIYTADWNSIKLSAAYAFTWIESKRYALSGQSSMPAAAIFDNVD